MTQDCARTAVAVADIVAAVQLAGQVMVPMEVLVACRSDKVAVGLILSGAWAAMLVQSRSDTAKMMQRIDWMAFGVVKAAKADHLC